MPLHAAMLLPLAGLDVPCGHAIATALALYVPGPGVYDVIAVRLVSVSTPVTPGQYVAALVHLVKSLTFVCAPAVSA